MSSDRFRSSSMRPLEVALELGLQRACRQLGYAASAADDLGFQSLQTDLYLTKAFLQICLDEVQLQKRHEPFKGQMTLLPQLTKLQEPPL